MESRHRNSVSGIAVEHPELINGMEAVYQTLIDLDYVQNTDVQVPPHGMPKDPMGVAQLRSVGLDPETIELIGRLPAFTNAIIELQRETTSARDGIPIAPFSSATSYLVGSGRHDEAREVGTGLDGGEELLPTTAFKLATTSNPSGCNLAYDLADKSIIKWHPEAWDKRERVPVVEFLEHWINHLKNLQWLPWKDDLGWEIEEQQHERHKELEDPDSPLVVEIKRTLEREKEQATSQDKNPKPIEELFAHYSRMQKAAHNRYWSRRIIYEESGWPESFDKELFKRRQDRWNERAKELGASANTKCENADEDEQAQVRLRDFHKAAAGEHAV